ncbi:hypothetical protein LV779_06725 [Streptomyces thinghirensis]|nr:hypothetical protein [Streptomyces thinghirensis]
MLGETVVHGEDIRRPLGIRRDHPVEVVTRVARVLPGIGSSGPRQGRVDGLRLVADDAPSRPARGRSYPAPPCPW